jgi:hypothetical protein
MIKRYLVQVVMLFLLGFAKTSTAVEVSHFDILLFGDKVGHLTISKEVKVDGSELYIMDSYSKATILWTNHENATHYEVVYKNGRLLSSRFKEIENGTLKRWNTVNWDGRQYVLDGYKGKRTFTEVPVISVVSLFFNDISKNNKLFYEGEGDFTELKHLDANTVEFKSSDGNRNVYHYVNGKAENMDIHVSIATVKMVRVN